MAVKTLVVDDTLLYRVIVQDALARIVGVEVLGTAKNGREALKKILDLRPDLVILDVEMPEMSGIELLKELKAMDIKIGVVMLSSVTTRGGDMTIQALQAGAFDFITKPEGGTPQENQDMILASLTPIVRTFQKKIALGESKVVLPVPGKKSTGHGKSRIVVIGISTGGPQALITLITQFTHPPKVPILIVQHMPPIFTQSLAASLASKACFPVKEAQNGEILLGGTVYLAPGGLQMKLSETGGLIKILVNSDPPENNCRPSVDYLFRSVSQIYREKATGVIMTGMGCDGTMGTRLMKRMGAWIIAQDEASCVVFSMPREAIKAGVVDEVVPLARMARAIEETLG